MNQITQVGVGSFGGWLVEKISERKCSETKVAKEIGMTNTSISRYINMRCHPRYLTVQRLCAYFEEDDVDKIYQKVLEDIELEGRVRERRAIDTRRFGGWLEEQIGFKKLSVTEFAEKIGVSYVTVFRHLREKAYPPKWLIDCYAIYFGVSILDIYDRIDYSKRHPIGGGGECDL